MGRILSEENKNGEVEVKETERTKTETKVSRRNEVKGENKSRTSRGKDNRRKGLKLQEYILNKWNFESNIFVIVKNGRKEKCYSADSIRFMENDRVAITIKKGILTITEYMKAENVTVIEASNIVKHEERTQENISTTTKQEGSFIPPIEELQRIKKEKFYEDIKRKNSDVRPSPTMTMVQTEITLDKLEEEK